MKSMKFLSCLLAIVISLSCSICPAKADESEQAIPLSDETVTTFGRTYYSEDSLHFNWTNSGFAFSFTGTDVKAEFTTATTFNQAFLRVYVDDVPLEKDIVLQNNKTYTVTLVKDLENTSHTVRVVKRTENGWGGMVSVSKLLVTGSMNPPPANPQRVIEVVGDSITCGYGNLTDKRVLNNYQSNRQDGTKTFATLTAEKFGAQCNVIAKSGIGFGCNNGGGKTDTMLDAYAYTDYFNGQRSEWDFAAHPSNVVIIALGTNDTANGDAADYSAKAKAMLNLVRQKNPDAYIIWAYEMMTASRSEVLMQICNEAYEAGDTKVFYHRLGLMDKDADGTGDGGHPSMATHIKDSEGLAALIAEITGWQQGTTGTDAKPELRDDSFLTLPAEGVVAVDPSNLPLTVNLVKSQFTNGSSIRISDTEGNEISANEANVPAGCTLSWAGSDSRILAVYGDVNADGTITAADALLILKHAVGKQILTGASLVAAKVTKADTPSAADALQVLKFAVNKIDSFQ